MGFTANGVAFDASQKLAFAQAAGSIVLASGTIGSAVDWVELALPSGYAEFEIRLRSILSDSMSPFWDSIVYQLSEDGGATWHSASSDYNCAFLQTQGGKVGICPSTDPTVGPGASSGLIQRDTSHDDVAYFAAAARVTMPADSTLILFPGDGVTGARGRSASFVYVNSDTDVGHDWVNSSLIASVARQNRFRFGYYPGDGELIAQGTYSLRGLA